MHQLGEGHEKEQQGKREATPISRLPSESSSLRALSGFHHAHSLPMRSNSPKPINKGKGEMSCKESPCSSHSIKSVMASRVRKSASVEAMSTRWPNMVFKSPVSRNVGMTSPSEVVESTSAIKGCSPRNSVMAKAPATVPQNTTNCSSTSFADWRESTLKSISMPDWNMSMRKPSSARNGSHSPENCSCSRLLPSNTPKRISATGAGIRNMRLTPGRISAAPETSRSEYA